MARVDVRARDKGRCAAPGMPSCRRAFARFATVAHLNMCSQLNLASTYDDRARGPIYIVMDVPLAGTFFRRFEQLREGSIRKKPSLTQNDARGATRFRR